MSEEYPVEVSCSWCERKFSICVEHPGVTRIYGKVLCDRCDQLETWLWRLGLLAFVIGVIATICYFSYY